MGGHAAALHGTSFTLDDHRIVERNPRLLLEDWEDVRTLVASDYWNEPGGAERLWRPLSLLTFALERPLHGGDSDAFHRTNVLLHGLTSVGVWLFCLPLLRSRAGALLAAAVFALHPVHAEAVAGLVGRAEVLALLFTLAAFLVHRRARAPGRRRLAALGAHGLAALCFFLAFTAKEIALAAPFALVVVDVALRRRGPAPAGRRRAEPRASRLRALGAALGRGLTAAAPYLLYGAAIAAYFGARWWALGDVLPRPGARTLGALEPARRALLACFVYADALASLVVPHATAAHYPFLGAWLEPLRPLFVPGAGGGHPPEPPSWALPWSVLPVVLHAALLYAGLLLLLARQGWARAAGVGVWGFYLTLGPVSNLLVPIGVLRADRLLYTPSLFVCLLLAAVLTRLLRGRDRRARAAVVAALLSAFALLLGGNVRAWTDDERLWRQSLTEYPGEGRPHVALGRELLKQERDAEALARLETGVELSPPGAPEAARARAWLGRALQTAGRLDAAEQRFYEARSLDPSSSVAARGLAHLYLERARDASADAERRRYLLQAEDVAREGTRFAPGSYELWLLRGTVLQRLEHRQDEAEAAYTTAIRLSPAPWQARTNRGLLRLGDGRRAAALADLRAAAELLRAQPHRDDQQERVLRDVMLKRSVLALGAGRRAEATRCLEWSAARLPPGPQREEVRALLRRVRQ